ncbi:hypothetical protein M378DRAFT_163642 [Amanita muscaria Koide BX008]|uniref:Uncharacterized protein n=1 Tax=Amanita muscaria (strain Koide BX008) TaxID=946122 RepID=A0A0C2X612_AMAMK|nr:hypothetical protein M378DRAFT_163642 [Amanita muscaria Koide BX008]
MRTQTIHILTPLVGFKFAEATAILLNASTNSGTPQHTVRHNNRSLLNAHEKHIRDSFNRHPCTRLLSFAHKDSF